MIKNLLQLYALVSCLIYGIVCLVFLGLSFNNTTIYLFPEIKHHYVPSSLQTNEEYKRDYASRHKETLKLKDEEVTALRLKELKEKEEAHQEESKKKALADLIFEAQWLFLGLLFWGIHWRLYKRSRKEVF